MNRLHNLKFWSASAGRMMRLVRCPGTVPVRSSLYVDKIGRLIADDYPEKTTAPRALPERLKNEELSIQKQFSTNINTGVHSGKKI